MIGQTQDDTKGHLSDPEDDGELHLERVLEGDLIHRHLPNL